MIAHLQESPLPTIVSVSFSKFVIQIDIKFSTYCADNLSEANHLALMPSAEIRKHEIDPCYQGKNSNHFMRVLFKILTSRATRQLIAFQSTLTSR